MSLYRSVFENVMMPAHNVIRRRSYVRHRRFLEESQWWSRERVLEFQWQELRRLLKHAFDTVPYYRAKYRAAGAEYGDIRTLEDYAKLPPLTRAEVNEHREQLCSTSFPGKRIAHATGGSTGVPTRFYLNWDSYDWRTAASHRAYSWSGYRVAEKSLWLWGAPVGRLAASKRMKLAGYYAMQRMLMFSTFAQTPEFWRQVYERGRRYRPRFLVGYVSSLEEFARFCAGNGLRLDTVEGVIAAAEPLHEPQRQFLQASLGAPVFNTYGSREFMSIAAECDRREGLHVHAENLLVQGAAPGADGPSELLVTDLHNYGMPFLRYANGDVAVLTDGKCSCGRGLPMLRSVEGRVLDLLRTADGRIVPGEFFPHVLKDIPEVREFLVEQVDVREIRVSAVLNAEISTGSRELLEKEVQKVIGAGTVVRLERVDSIPRMSSGKRRVTVGIGAAR